MLAVTFLSKGNEGLADAYRDALSRAGVSCEAFDCGKPLDAEAAAARYAALLLTGGGDVDPRLYGRADGGRCQWMNAARDANELALCRAFSDARKPIFGICRGIQVVNVAFGGTLIQHIDGHSGENFTGVRHRAVFNGHSGIARGEAEINSFHHQCVGEPAPGFAVAARAPDGVVEELVREYPFVLGVQWHPERDADALSARFFALVRAASEDAECGAFTRAPFERTI